MYAVVVTFKIKETHWDAFVPAMANNAQTSLDVEPGCHHFDVCTDTARPFEVFLYELYTDQATFEAHLNSPHFKSFDAHVAPMIASKEVRTYAEVAS